MKYLILFIALILSTASVVSAENITTNMTPENMLDTVANDENTTENNTPENISKPEAYSMAISAEDNETQSQIDEDWYPYIPLTQDPKYYYTVRLWVYDHDPVWNQSAPVTWHELSDAEFTYLGEDRQQHVSVLKYDAPNPLGQTVYGLYHQELNFVLWMAIFPPVNGQLGQYAQVGETAKDQYNNSLTPAQNDALGKISWFIDNGTWYPRTWTKSQSWDGQTWSELWGPFDPDPQGNIFRERNYTVSFLPVSFKGKDYDGIKVIIVGPSETSQDIITTEAYTFIDGIGMVQRYLSMVTVSNPTSPIPPNTMIFLHIATLIDANIPSSNPITPENPQIPENEQFVNGVTIPMQSTGISFTLLIMAILSISSGLIINKK